MEGVSGKTQLKIVKELKDLGLIEVEIFRNGHSHVKLVRITECGWDFLKDKSNFKPLRGGITHTHICRWIEWVGKKRGYEESICEWQVTDTNGFCDVAFKIDGRWHCVEVVVDCDSNIEKHIKDCFIKSKAVKSLTIVTTQKKHEWDKINGKIMSNPELVFFMNRITLETADTYYRELWGNNNV